MGSGIRIYKGVSLIVNFGGMLEIDDDVMINMHSLVYCSKRVYIGKHSRIGWQSQIVDSNFHFSIDLNTGKAKNHNKEIFIGNNVWITNRCTIAPGAYIPPFSIVASNSLVNKDFSSTQTLGNLLYGMPAKIKYTGIVRILNERIEKQMKNKFLTGCGDELSIDELGYMINDVNGESNALFRSFD